MDIEFPQKSSYVFSQDAVAFPVVVDGAERRCLVSRDHLHDHYGAGANMDIVGVFEDNRYYIEGKVIDRIKAGVEGTILLN